MPPRTRTTNRTVREPDDLTGAHRNGQLDPTVADRDETSTPRDATTTGITIRLPSLGDITAKRLLWYGGLGALATLGVLDWPVALVVGTGTLIATRTRPNPPEN